MENVKLQLERTSSGMYTGKIEVNSGQYIFLHSSLDPIQEAAEWEKRIAIKQNVAYLVLGFGLGYHVEKLKNRLLDQSQIYIIETMNANTAQIAYNVLSELGIDMEWMREGKITYYASDDLRNIAADIVSDIVKRRLKGIVLCKHYPSMQKSVEFYKSAERQLPALIEELFYINFNTRSAFGKKNLQNYISNIPFILRNKGIIDLKNKFFLKPAIIISAGPSLDHNIEHLHGCENKALLIAAGSAMGALKKNNIKPHILAVLDPQDLMYDHDLVGMLDKDTLLLATYNANNKVVKNHPGKMIFCKDKEESIYEMLEEYLPETDAIQSNVSVASLAVNFALYCGANPVIFVGQDLAFFETQYHASGVQADKYDEFKKVTVPGYYEDEVLTTPQFKDLIAYFETLIRTNRNTIFINATEGGACIQGAIQMELNKVKEKYLKSNAFPGKILSKSFRKKIEIEDADLINHLSNLNLEIQETFRKIEGICSSALTMKIGEKERDFLELRQTVINSKVYLYLQTPLDVCLDYMEYRQGIIDNEEEYTALLQHTCREILNVLELFKENIKGIVNSVRC